MSSPNDTTNYIQTAIDNIYTVINNYQSYIGFVSLSKTDDAFIPKYPSITIDFDSMTSEWKSMPKRMTLNMNFSITCYYANISDKNAREGVRDLLSKVANCIRENWNLNGFAPDLGSEVLSAIPYVLASGDATVVGGVISLAVHKIISVTLT